MDSAPSSPLPQPSEANSADEDRDSDDELADFLNPKATEKYIRPSKRPGQGVTGRVNSPKRQMGWGKDESILYEGESEAECDDVRQKHMLSISRHPWQPDFGPKGKTAHQSLIAPA